MNIPSAAIADQPEQESRSEPQRTRSSLGRLVYAWSAAARRRELKAPTVVRTAWNLERYFLMDKSFDTYAATGRTCAFPSIERLANDIGLHRRTVQRALHTLEAEGLIECDTTRGGRMHTNKYWLIPQTPPADDTVKGGDPTALYGAERAAASDRKGRQPPTQRAVTPDRKGRWGHRPNTNEAQAKLENTRAPTRDAAPSRDAGASRRRAGGGRGPDISNEADYFAYVDSLTKSDDDDDDCSRPSKTRTPDEYDTYREALGPDDETDDRYEWLRDQLSDLSATDATALIEQHRQRLDRRDFVSLQNLIRRRK